MNKILYKLYNREFERIPKKVGEKLEIVEVITKTVYNSVPL